VVCCGIETDSQTLPEPPDIMIFLYAEEFIGMLALIWLIS
jgi:hypothetical protein